MFLHILQHCTALQCQLHAVIHAIPYDLSPTSRIDEETARSRPLRDLNDTSRSCCCDRAHTRTIELEEWEEARFSDTDASTPKLDYVRRLCNEKSTDAR
jgi:hypothetical protein